MFNAKLAARLPMDPRSGSGRLMAKYFSRWHMSENGLMLAGEYVKLISAKAVPNTKERSVCP